MKHYQKLYYKHFYAQDENGEYIPVSKKVCFAPAEEPDTTNPYKQRWFYDQERLQSSRNCTSVVQ